VKVEGFRPLPEVAREIFQLAIDSKDPGLGMRLVFFEDGADPGLATLSTALQGVVDRTLTMSDLTSFASAGASTEQVAAMVEQAHRAEQLIQDLRRVNEQADFERWRYAD